MPGAEVAHAGNIGIKEALNQRCIPGAFRWKYQDWVCRVIALLDCGAIAARLLTAGA